MENHDTLEHLIKDLIFPIKVYSINETDKPGGIKKSRVKIQGRYTTTFPLNLEDVIKIVKEMTGIDIEITFEEKLIHKNYTKKEIFD